MIWWSHNARLFGRKIGQGCFKVFLGFNWENLPWWLGINRWWKYLRVEVFLLNIRFIYFDSLSLQLINPYMLWSCHSWLYWAIRSGNLYLIVLRNYRLITIRLDRWFIRPSEFGLNCSFPHFEDRFHPFGTFRSINVALSFLKFVSQVFKWTVFVLLANSHSWNVPLRRLRPFKRLMRLFISLPCRWLFHLDWLFIALNVYHCISNSIVLIKV